MDTEILFGGIIGLSFVAVLVFLLTGHDAFDDGAADRPPTQTPWADEEDPRGDDRR